MNSHSVAERTGEGRTANTIAHLTVTFQSYFVEVDVVMSRDTPLWKAHDLSQQLQDKLEMLPNVGRAFVHVDHETSHRPVRVLLQAAHLSHEIPFLSGAPKAAREGKGEVDTLKTRTRRKSRDYHTRINNRFIMRSCLYAVRYMLHSNQSPRSGPVSIYNLACMYVRAHGATSVQPRR